MRLNDHLLMQVVDDDPPVLVFLDESIGAEVTRPLDIETTLHLIDDVTVARIEHRPATVDGISIPVECFDQLLVGLGQFVGRYLG